MVVFLLFLGASFTVQITICLSVRSLKTQLETTRQEEEIRLREEIKVELQKFHTELHSEMDAGKEKIRYQIALKSAYHPLRGKMR